jgi:hypothetical protein
MPDPLAWMSQQLSLVEPPAPVRRFNPRPPGVIRPGSATEAVIEFLRAHPGRFFEHHRIVAAVGRSKVATDWALAYLREQGLVEAIADPRRNERYLRYRAIRVVCAEAPPR